MRILFPGRHRQYILELERELKEMKNQMGVAWALYNGDEDLLAGIRKWYADLGDWGPAMLPGLHSLLSEY